MLVVATFYFYPGSAAQTTVCSPLRFAAVGRTAAFSSCAVEANFRSFTLLSRT